MVSRYTISSKLLIYNNLRSICRGKLHSLLHYTSSNCSRTNWIARSSFKEMSWRDSSFSYPRHYALFLPKLFQIRITFIYVGLMG